MTVPAAAVRREAAAAERVADDGVFEVDPTGSAGTPEGLRIYRWSRLKVALSVLGYLGSPLLIRYRRH